MTRYERHFFLQKLAFPISSEYLNIIAENKADYKVETEFKKKSQDVFAGNFYFLML